MPDPHLLTAHILYNPTTGVLTRRNTGKPVFLEPRNKGRYRIEINKQRFDNMQAAWFLHTGEFTKYLYPKDGDRKNTKLSNIMRPPPNTKRCSTCQECKPLTEFSPKLPTALASSCRACRKEKYKHPRREQRLAQNFNISVQAYEELLAAQGGVCAICKKPPPENRRLAVDHCHDSEVVRGLLCTACNIAIGALDDNPENLERAIKYLTSV